jgi:HlyD family secretion protein
LAVQPADRLTRKLAMDRLASPEQLTELVAVTDIRGWAAGLGLCIVAAAALAWSLLGTIDTEVGARGILVREGGRLVGAMSPSAGIILDISVKPGDTVERGQVLATLRQVGTELRVAAAEQVLAENQEDLDTRTEALRKQAEALEANAVLRRAAYGQVLSIAEQRTQRLQRQLAIRSELRTQNLTLEERVEQARTDLGLAQQDASEARARLVEIETDLLRSQLDAEKELGELQSKVADARRALTSAQSELTETRGVIAPANGRVTELTISEGQLITANQLVLNLETEGARLQAVVYVPTEHGKKVTPGMPVRIALATVKQEEWGTLLGTVSSISAFPSSPQGMAAVLQNPQLVQSFGGQTPPFEARIELGRAETPSGYAWTSGTGPELALTSGTTLRAEIAVRQDAPIDLILPALRRALGFAR